MPTQSQILVVEDETDVRNLMILHLKRENYRVIGVANGEEALRLFQETHFNLVILDWMLPGLSGLELCKKIFGQDPILMVTARADTADIVLGLEMGANDYITKPFEVPVFLARVRALLRKTKDPKASYELILTLGDLELNIPAHSVKCGGHGINLTVSEFKLLVALIKNSGRVLSRDQLIELVQGEGVAVVDRAIDTHVFGLRKKLGACADVIETIRGIGYRVKN